ncbi:6-phosphogluconolactonase [Alcaligenaceae bacterium]|nr:6-phosphogluconolactonase [Alcaligenaceae bacterium]
MWHEFTSSTGCVAAMVRNIGNELQREVHETGNATLAVSGGRSPIPLFEALAQADLPWRQITVALVDERHVPLDHPDSNEKLVRSYLLQGKAALAKFTGLVTDPDNIAASVAHSNTLSGNLTVVILGMGDDGHTASLFPEAPQLTEGLAPDQAKRYLHMTPGLAAHERISMTLAAMLGSKRIVLGIAGGHKRRIYEEAATQVTPALPISYVVAQKEVPLDVYWHP